MSMRWFWILLVGVFVACSDSTEESESDSVAPTAPELQRSTFEMSARVLGPVQNDDDADLRIALRKTNGVAAHLNSLVLRWTNGVERQWGAGNIAADRGSNRIEGNTELVDATGFQHHVVAAPFHLDWPGV